MGGGNPPLPCAFCEKPAAVIDAVFAFRKYGVGTIGHKVTARLELVKAHADCAVAEGYGLKPGMAVWTKPETEPPKK